MAALYDPKDLLAGRDPYTRVHAEVGRWTEQELGRAPSDLLADLDAHQVRAGHAPRADHAHPSWSRCWDSPAAADACHSSQIRTLVQVVLVGMHDGGGDGRHRLAVSEVGWPTDAQQPRCPPGP